MYDWDREAPPFSFPQVVALRERSWPRLLTFLGRLWMARRTVFDVALAEAGILRDLTAAKARAANETNEIEDESEYLRRQLVDGSTRIDHTMEDVSCAIGKLRQGF